MCDSKGVIYKGRTDLNPQKEEFAVDTPCRTLAEAMVGADIFLGFSAPNCVTGEMVKTMAKDPIIFAMANPVPEIFPDVAIAAGAKIVGTGRSDYANQINNVLGFPGIFRGALDTRSKDINEEMKLAASLALAELAEWDIPADIKKELAVAYPEDAAKGMFDFGVGINPDMVIPKPFDPRVVPHVARRVAEAAIKSGVAPKTNYTSKSAPPMWTELRRFAIEAKSSSVPSGIKYCCSSSSHVMQRNNCESPIKPRSLQQNLFLKALLLTAN